MRFFLVALGLLVACGGSHSAPISLAGSGGAPDGGAPSASDSGTPDASPVDAGAPDAGSVDAGALDAGPLDGGAYDAGTPDAGSIDAGAPDAGTIDAGMADAGTPDGGSSDAGVADAGADGGPAATIDCAPYGTARLAWKLTGYQNPSNNYDANWYYAVATDTLDGVLIRRGTAAGHFQGSFDSTYSPDGGLRVPSLAYYSCHPVQGCFESSEVISKGTIYQSGGVVRSAQDGHVIYQFDPVPAGADAGAFWVQEGVAANGSMAVFTWSNYQAPTATATALDSDGGTLWQRTFPHAVEAAAVDDSGVALLRMSYAGDLVAIAPDGGTQYTQTPDVNLRGLQAAGGRFYLGGRTLYRVADGSLLTTLKVDAWQSPPLLTASRLYLWSNDNGTAGPVIAIDPATGNTIWERARRLTTAPAFSVTGDRAVIIDPQDVLHLLRADGTDLLACKVAPDVADPVLLSGGRLAVSRYPNLEVYDLPWLTRAGSGSGY